MKFQFYFTRNTILFNVGRLLHTNQLTQECFNLIQQKPSRTEIKIKIFAFHSYNLLSLSADQQLFKENFVLRNSIIYAVVAMNLLHFTKIDYSKYREGAK